MDATRFDHFVQSFATGATRRGALVGVLATLGLGAATPKAAAA